MGDTVFGDKYEGDHIRGNKIVVRGRAERPATPPRRPVVLVMSADSGAGASLRLDEERREIDRAVTYARDCLEVRTADALRLDDLHTALLRHRPAIVHFSGHGTAPGGIQLVDDLGTARPVPPDALTDLFEILGAGLSCVVLNACFTAAQAEAIAAHVPYVVGMAGRIRDDAAIRFSASFYSGVAHGRSIRESFGLGRNRLRLHGYPDPGIVRLLAAPDAADLTVIRPSRH